MNCKANGMPAQVRLYSCTSRSRRTSSRLLPLKFSGDSLTAARIVLQAGGQAGVDQTRFVYPYVAKQITIVRRPSNPYPCSVALVSCCPLQWSYLPHRCLSEERRIGAPILSSVRCTACNTEDPVTEANSHSELPSKNIE